VPAVSDSPLFDVDPMTQACTALVTSTVTNAPAALTCNEPTNAPMPGSVEYVTPYSLHAPFTIATDTAPGVSARLQ
jgi:hypothetical protein